MKLDSKVITGLASTLILGVCAWLLNTTLEVQKDIVEVKIQNENIIETLDKVYAENCPYCVHAAHTGIQEHPLLKPTIKQAHRHVGNEIIIVNED
jgi:hypothetical protein